MRKLETSSFPIRHHCPTSPLIVPPVHAYKMTVPLWFKRSLQEDVVVALQKDGLVTLQQSGILTLITRLQKNGLVGKLTRLEKDGVVGNLRVFTLQDDGFVREICSRLREHGIVGQLIPTIDQLRWIIRSVAALEPNAFARDDRRGAFQ